MSCLLSKLNGEVDNASLPKIGELILHIENDFSTGFHSYDCFEFVVNRGKEVTVEVIGEGTLSYSTDGSNPFTSTTCSSPTSIVKYDIYFSTGTYDVKISSKYDIEIQYLPASCTNWLSDFAYFSDAIRVKFAVTSISNRGNTKIRGALSDFKKFKGHLYGISINYSPYVTGDLTDLLELNRISEFEDLKFNSSMLITGDVRVLAAFYNVKTFGFPGTNLTGDIVNLLDGMYANGRISGTCTIILSAQGPTFNGEHPTGYVEKKFDFSESGWTLQS